MKTFEINSLAEAIEKCKDEHINFDLVYYHPIEGIRSDNAPVHYYFNLGNLNRAYYTPALRVLTIFTHPRFDSLTNICEVKL